MRNWGKPMLALEMSTMPEEVHVFPGECRSLLLDVVDLADCHMNSALLDRADR